MSFSQCRNNRNMKKYFFFSKKEKRDVSLSDSYTSVGDVFPVWQSSYTDKTILPFPFTLIGIWSWWQFSFQFWTKWNSIWFRQSKGKLSPRSDSIQLERKSNTSFLSAVRKVPAWRFLSSSGLWWLWYFIRMWYFSLQVLLENKKRLSVIQMIYNT